MLKFAHSNFQNNTFDNLTQYDILFHTTADTSDVVKIEVTKLQHFTMVIMFRIC